MREPFTLAGAVKPTDFRQILRDQVQRLTGTVKVQEPYQPFYTED